MHPPPKWVAPFASVPHIESREIMLLTCLLLLPGVRKVSCCWGHSSLPSQPNFFGLLIWNKDQQLFRNPPDLQHPTRTVETFSLRTEQQLHSQPLQRTGSHCWMTRPMPRKQLRCPPLLQTHSVGSVPRESTDWHTSGV